MTRAFIAIDLDGPTRAALARLSRRLARALPATRIVAPETFHLTLAFLGELEAARVEDAIHAARAAAMGASPFWLAPGLLDAFGPEYAPRVLWVGIGGQVGDLLQLQRHLAHALDTRGFALDGKPYAPHLTLARLTAPLDQAAALRLRHLRSEPPAREESWLVDSLLVMRSDLAPGGPAIPRWPPSRSTPAADAPPDRRPMCVE